MTVPVPAAGDPITAATWGALVAAQLNGQIPLVMTADVATNSTSWADLATMAVVSGTVYMGAVYVRSTPTATNQGAGIGFNHPGGTFFCYMDHMVGAGTGVLSSQERVTATDTGGPSTSDNTNARLHKIWLYYACSVSGTLALRGRRNGTTGAPGITFAKGSGGILTLQS